MDTYSDKHLTLAKIQDCIDMVERDHRENDDDYDGENYLYNNEDKEIIKEFKKRYPGVSKYPYN